MANRKSFDERFAEEVLHRSLGDLPVAMLLWDIDDFKAINDGYGHRAGDRVLQTVAQCFVSEQSAKARTSASPLEPRRGPAAAARGAPPGQDSI